jgi:predicted AlkP superfamily phosphohydrolase/phosphomutase
MLVLILGFDSFDPTTFETLSSQGKLPNLTRYAEQGGYARLQVCDPPQTEVSWTSIATGLDPGGHGIFDFVHRDPATYLPYPSLLPTRHSPWGIQFVSPFNARTIFDEVAHQGYPAITLWWPATFPAKLQSLVQTIPGLGTPDINGRLGVGTCFTTDPSLRNQERKTPIRLLQKRGKDYYTADLEGPTSKKGKTTQSVTTLLQLIFHEDKSADLMVNERKISLVLGRWSPIFEITFKIGPFLNLRTLTRAILTQTHPDVRLYLLPLQIHPLASPWRYAAPPSFPKQIWKACGPYLTIGWPQDTTALEEGLINDDQFLDLCLSIHHTRVCILENRIQTLREGILAAIFDCLDRVQHMFRGHRQDIVEDWYIRLDDLVGQIAPSITNRRDVKLFILSDHGFTDFRYKVHLNRWLMEKGYLVSNTNKGTGGLEDVNWSRTLAYAVGLNSIYTNLANRESQGILTQDQHMELLPRLKEQLENWQGPDGQPVVQRVLFQWEAFQGPYSRQGPDLVIGYSPGYRASAETGLGKWKESSIEPNNDHWRADHCVNSQSVPAVLFSNSTLQGFSHLSFRDIPALVLGKPIEQTHFEPHPPSSLPEEDRKALEERLKSLGYL